MDRAEEFEFKMKELLEPINEATAAGDSDIQMFYNGSTIFLTGGTGFLGKHLIEKLFRSSKIRRIYLLLRPKRGKIGKERINDILKDPAFDNLRTNQPGFEDRIAAINGDIASPRLGITDDDWKTIVNETNVILHVAATVRFDEPLRTAVPANVLGTREVLTLAYKCRKLKSFVYVSTAFSHATVARINDVVYEKFYATPIDPDELLNIIKNMPEESPEITKKLIQGWPNTYSFTKAVAEELVRRTDNVSICIVRPTVVISTYKEPAPGWICPKAVNGASGLTLGCIMGVIHAVSSRQSMRLDLIPVDYVNNTILAAAWKTAQLWTEGQKDTIIYHATSSRHGSHWSDLSRTLNYEVTKYLSPKIIGPIFAFETSCIYLHVLLTAVFHFLPAFIVDAVAILCGKRPTLIKMYKKIYTMSDKLSYFTKNGWIFSDINTQKLSMSMSNVDNIIFNFDVIDIDFVKMITIWAIGLRRYIVKDGLKDTEWGVRKQKYFKYSFLCLLCIVLYLFCKFIS